jgi:hypothetical protein
MEVNVDNLLQLNKMLKLFKRNSALELISHLNRLKATIEELPSCR